MRRIGEHAVVIGGSVAGLLAARALTEAYDRVTVIDRDALPDGVADRRAVPQGRHAHALLSSGRRALEWLFPGFVEELTGKGALAVDIKGLRWFDNGGYHARCTGIEALLASRALLETHLRTRVKAVRQVRLIDGCDVESLTLTPIVTCTAGAVVALADGSSAIAATEPTTNKMDNRVLIDGPRVDRNRAGGLCGSRTSNGGRCRRGTPLHPTARRYLTVRYPVIPSST